MNFLPGLLRKLRRCGIRAAWGQSPQGEAPPMAAITGATGEAKPLGSFLAKRETWFFVPLPRTRVAKASQGKRSGKVLALAATASLRSPAP
jgi:hypothetical protein